MRLSPAGASRRKIRRRSRCAPRSLPYSAHAMTADHVALVTGGGGGIGTATSLALAGAGATVLVSGRDELHLQASVEAVRAAGGVAHPLCLDVCDGASIRDARQRALELVGPVDWVVANAGVAISAALTSDEAESVARQQMDVNYHGARRVFETFLPHMLKRGQGRIVMVASSAALLGYPYITGYAASKHALLGYARSAALEMNSKGVGVGVVCPHYVDTPMTDASVARIVDKTGRDHEQARAALAELNPGGKLVQADEVASVILRLLQSELSGTVVELTGSEQREIESGLLIVPNTPKGD
jgi:3-hydroxybutyrate dehydrogenase